MPELPEVETTARGLRAKVVGSVIKNVWTDYGSKYFKGSETIKDPAFFPHFKKAVTGAKITSVERRAKNILLNLDNGKTILAHMKMTGHFLYGKYRLVRKNKKETWEPVEPESLKDPYNRHIHLMFTFKNGSNLALSDVRTFAKVTVISTDVLHESLHLAEIGPEPLDKIFGAEEFSARLDRRPLGKIKQVLTDQTVVAGIGNIYADESLWRAGIHPLELVKNISKQKRAALLKAVKEVLTAGIASGGDSISDYRNIDGEKGKMQMKHHAYQRTGDKCDKPGCGGIIKRIVVGGRGTHFCPRHQRLK